MLLLPFYRGKSHTCTKADWEERESEIALTGKWLFVPFPSSSGIHKHTHFSLLKWQKAPSSSSLLIALNECTVQLVQCVRSFKLKTVQGREGKKWQAILDGWCWTVLTNQCFKRCYFGQLDAPPHQRHTVERPIFIHSLFEIPFDGHCQTLFPKETMQCQTLYFNWLDTSNPVCCDQSNWLVAFRCPSVFWWNAAML